MHSLNINYLQKLFKNPVKRRDFIDSLDYNKIKHTDKSLFKNIISSNSNTKNTKLLIDLMDFCISIKYYNRSIFENSWDVFYYKKFWFRITFLDYLFNFKSKIGIKRYNNINFDIFKTSKNLEIKFQACLNLYLTDCKYESKIEYFLKLASKTSNHYIFYRAAHFINNTNSVNTSSIKKVIRKLLVHNETIPISQRKEIIKMVR